MTFAACLRGWRSGSRRPDCACQPRFGLALPIIVLGLLSFASTVAAQSVSGRLIAPDEVALYIHSDLRHSDWTDGYAEDGCGPVGVPELEYLFGWSGWGPIFIQPKGDPKCHRCVCA
jgi:hypothetical protein